jgi:ABC-type phosphate transport system substrate-binding protein
VFTRNRVIATALAIPALTALLVSGLTAPAQADPASTGATYAGVGSDTTQDVVQALSVAVGSFESWNATNPTTGGTYDNIVPKGNAANTLNRPNGSGNGIAALRIASGLYNSTTDPAAVITYAGAHPVPAGSVDFARSSRGPSDTSDASLTFIPFGVDAVDYAVVSGGVLDQAFPSGLTTAQLKAIYACTLTTVTVGGTNYTIQPYVPQAGSGTRSFFEGAVGLADSAVNTTCVKDTKVGTGASIEEHDGRVLTDPTVGGVNYLEVAPISIAQNIAQTNSAFTGVTDRRGNSELGVLDGVAPTAGTAPAQTINTAFPSTFTRNVYNVFPTTKVSGLFADPTLVSLFVGNSSTVCAQTDTIRLYGFLTNSTCGSTSLTGKF